MFEAGDLVVYSRPHPDEVGEVFQVESVMEDEEGVWVLVVDGGCWEQAREFAAAA